MVRSCFREGDGGSHAGASLSEHHRKEKTFSSPAVIFHLALVHFIFLSVAKDKGSIELSFKKSRRKDPHSGSVPVPNYCRILDPDSALYFYLYLEFFPYFKI